jgi:hypothetical protein
MTNPAPIALIVVGIGCGSGASKTWKDGQTWTAVNAGVYSRLNDIWGAGPSDAWDAWIFDDGGLILRWDGMAWIASPSGTVRNLARITGTATGDAWVVGAGGAELHHSRSW